MESSGTPADPGAPSLDFIGMRNKILCVKLLIIWSLSVSISILTTLINTHLFLYQSRVSWTLVLAQ